MRCPGCGADHPADARKCPGCGSRLPKRRRRNSLDEEGDSAFGTPLTPAYRAFRLGLFSLIPVAGLVLGPAALVRAVAAWREGGAGASPTDRGYVGAALVLGLAALVCNAVGVILMVLGLTS
jgi:hypothetical protein